MKKNKIDIAKILFLLSLFLIQFATFSVNVTFISDYSTKLIDFSLVMLIFCFFVTIFKQKFNFKTLLVMFIIGTVSFISFLITNDSIMFQLFLIIICSLNISFDDIIKNDLIFKIILLIFIYMMQLLGNVHIDIFFRAGEIRHAFGFSQPNTFGFFIISLFFEFLYLKKAKIKYIYVIILFILCLYLLSMASSRSSQISTCLFMLLYSIYYLKNSRVNEKMGTNLLNKRNNKVPIFVLKLLFLILTFISFYITFEYITGDSTMDFINDILSNRVYLQSVFIDMYDINLLGNNIFYFETLDNVYIRTVLNFGVIAWFIYLYIYCSMISYANRKNDKLMLIIIFVLLIYGLMEWYIIRPAINIFLCYFSSILILKKNIK